MAVPPFEEAADSLAPSSDSLSAEDGACTRIWRTAKDYTLTNPQDLIDAETYFVGGTDTGVNPGGRLARKLPAPDPQHINWWCRKVNSVRGIADRNKVEGGYTIDLSFKDKLLGLGILPLNQTVLPGYALYPMYEFNLTSGPRPYPLVRDDKIATFNTSGPSGAALHFYWPDGETDSPYAYAEEWKRFCGGPKLQPQNDYVTAQQGSFIFRTSNAIPNGYAFTGMPRILLRTSVITMEWFMVPVRYVTSPRSFIHRFRGLVNQYPWYGPRGAERFGAGSLLYLNYEYGDFCPSLNGYEVIFPGDGGQSVDVLGSPRLCNVRLIFLHTDRKAKDPIVPAWKGWVVDGMNSLPWFGNPGAFYYSTSRGSLLGAANPANWFPMFNSFPIEILWMDPDAPQPGGAASPLANPGQGGI